MGEMVERVAQAMRDKYLDGATPDLDLPDPRRHIHWWRPYAWTAIIATREPTEAMTSAAARITGVSPRMADTAWRAMNDEALR